MQFRTVIYLFFVIGLLPITPVFSSGAEDHLQLLDETFLFQEIPSVFGASKYEQKITEAPSAVTIITAEDIQKYGYRTLGDALVSIRGFYQYYDGSIAKVGVRGFGLPGDTNTRILVLLDGQRTNDNIFESGHIASFDIVDVDLVDRIEVIRGPGSSLYGTNAVLSVINIITKRGREYDGMEVSGQAGSQESYGARLTYGARLSSGLEALFSANYKYKTGEDLIYYEEFDTPDTNNGVAEDLDEYRNYTLFTKVSFFDFTLEGFYLQRNKEIPTAPYGVLFNEPGTETEGKVGNLNLKYEHLFTNQIEFEANLAYNSYRERGDYVYEGPITNRDEFKGNWWGGDFQFGKRWERHHLISGGEYRNNFRQDQKNFDVEGETLFESQEDSVNWGIFAQEEYRIRGDLILNAGLRYDHYESFGGTTTPRIAVIYNPVEKTIFKLLYGRAFRAPNAFESFYHDGNVSWKPNPDLDPETIDTYELVWEQYLRDRWRGLATAFYYRIDDLVSLTLDPGDGLVIYQNIGEVEAKGIELEFEGKFNGYLEARLSYSYQQVEDRNTGEPIPNSPEHLGKLNLSFPVYQDKLFFSIEEQYTGKRMTVGGDSVDGFAVTNLTLLARDLIPDLNLSASVYNLFDEEYSDPVPPWLRQETIVQDGISFHFKVSYRF